MSEDPNEFAKDPEAAPVLGFIKAGLWRKARDAAKELCKRDRGRYLVLLIRANVGLVREMLGKGLLKEAETVVAYLASFAPAETVAALRAEMTAPTGKRQVAALADSGGAGWWVAALRADGILMKAGSVSPADQAAVDLLVTDVFVPDGAENDGQAVRLAAELGAVRAACAATGEGRWDEAKHALRDLPRRSIFWQWRIFLRGVRCVFEEERETARQCFAQLPRTGALARAAAALAPDLAVSSRPAPATATIPLFLAVTGQPGAWAAPILAATASWKAGKRVHAFDDLAVGIKEVFPSFEPGLPALLTDAVLPSHARMTDGDWEDSEKLHSRFCGERTKAKAQVSKASLAFMRSMCVAEKNEMPQEELDRCWRMVIELWQNHHGPDRQRDSLAWQWLGDALGNPSEVRGSPFENEGTTKRKNAAKALKAYENSIAADDTNEAAWLCLVSLLVRQGETTRSNRMLDDLVKKFPGNKVILTLAGDSAIERKSYPKGIAILRDALALDPLDKNLKERIVVALTLRVRDASRKGAPAAALWAEIEPLLENNPPAGHHMLSRWMARVRRSLLDKDPEVAAQAETDSIAMAPSTLIRLFFATVLAAVYGIPPRREWERAWTVAKSSPESTWKSLLDILRIFDFTSAISGWGGKQAKWAGDRVLQVAGHLLDSNRIKDDPAGLLESVGELEKMRKHASPSTSQAIGLVLRDISDALYQHVGPGAKKTDPRLRLASLLLSDCESQKALKYLKAITSDAEAAGLPECAARAKNLQEKIESRDFHQSTGFFGEDPDDYDEDDWDDDDDDDEDEDEDEDPFSAAFGMGQLMADLEKAIVASDAVAIERTRKSLMNLGLTADMVNTAIQTITQSQKVSPSRKTTNAKKAAKAKDAAKTAATAEKAAKKAATAKIAAKNAADKAANDFRQIDLF